MRRVTANGVDLAFVESGSGEPLVLLHGANSDRGQYDVFRPLLGEGIRAIAYDQRDAPDSPYEKAYTLNDHADDAAAFIAALGLERAHVMGASYGGIVAMVLALRHPACVKSLILASTTPSTEFSRAPDFAALRAEGADAVERYMLSTVMSPQAIDADPALVADVRGAMRVRSADSLARRMGALEGHDVRARLGEIAAPTLVLHGDEDPLIEASAGVFLASHIPGARFHLLAGERHGLTFQNRARTAALVREFVLAHG